MSPRTVPSSARRGSAGSLAIRVLGPLEVLVDGAPIVVDTRKALAILALLAVERRPFARDELAALLWPEADDESARGALRRTLSVLRAALGDRWLRVDRSAVDARRRGGARRPRTRSRRRRRAPTRRSSRRRPTSRAGRSSPGSRSVTARRLRRLAGDAGRRGGAVGRGAPRPARGRRGGERRRRRGARRRRATGRPRPARRGGAPAPDGRSSRGPATGPGRSASTGRASRVLERELGVAPLAETTELYEAIRDARADAGSRAGRRRARRRSPRPRADAAATPARLPIVGRRRELGIAPRRAPRVGDPDGRVAVVTGEAGIGKSRLVEAVVDAVEADGRPRPRRAGVRVRGRDRLRADRGAPARRRWAARTLATGVAALSRADARASSSGSSPSRPG